MSTENIKPEKITKPIQLLAAWLLGLIIINASFLTAAAQIEKPEWASGALVIATIINVPIFLASLFLLQTKFRPEMQEDTFYSKYLERKYNESQSVKEVKKLRDEDEKETKEVVDLISKEIASNHTDKKEKIETIIRNRDKQKIEKRVNESRALSQLFLYKDRWNEFLDKWGNDDNFKKDIEELFFYKVIDGDIKNPSKIKLTKIGEEIATKLSESKLLWNQKNDRII
ncbi:MULTISPECIES: hypothetical protein [Flavobacterium]|uniref:Uncharacterized protein n=1 Tax=Flavobacterium columnare TaxID=996 RepID=A0AA94F119_9FLAO|nr:hypothetical protein [Flavobacterium columnare]MCH4828632.1 hypothetical protein [Flavobacterium columnare]MCH4831885.1 hypothetical protein [Flavobacterium columnare]